MIFDSYRGKHVDILYATQTKKKFERCAITATNSDPDYLNVSAIVRHVTT
jgi:hypothetical protein